MAIPKRLHDWGPVKTAYLERSPRPTWKSLAEEFGFAEKTLTAVANDEGWALLRARRSEALVERSGAHDMLLAAAGNQKAITDKLTNSALIIVQGLDNALDEMDEKLAASTRVGLLNTAAFAVSNIARALKEAGVVGLPKALMDELSEKAPKGPEGKEYLRSALHQINITVQAARDGKPIPEVVVEEPKHRYPAGGVFYGKGGADVEEAVTTMPGKGTKEGLALSRLMADANRRSKAEREEVI